jgi:hypothetical protein
LQRRGGRNKICEKKKKCEIKKNNHDIDLACWVAPLLCALRNLQWVLLGHPTAGHHAHNQDDLKTCRTTLFFFSSFEQTLNLGEREGEVEREVASSRGAVHEVRWKSLDGTEREEEGRGQERRRSGRTTQFAVSPPPPPHTHTHTEP